MKRVVTCSIIIIFLVAAALTSYFTTKSTVEDISGYLIEAEESFKNKDYEKALDAAKKADGEWRKFFELHVFITDKEHMLEITSSLSRLTAFAEEEDDEFMIEVRSAKQLAEIYLQKQNPEIMNILSII